MNTKLLVGAGLSAIALAMAAKEAVIMTVNGTEVPQSEFEYLYNKNSKQQLNPQSIDEYVDMFQLYKLKVEDAKAEGLDTLESFRKEMAQYKHDLAMPYITDSLFYNNLLDEAVARAKEEAEAKHIMFFKTRDPQKNREARHRADSVLKVLRAGGDFAEMAAKYSQDKGSNQKGGNMGYIATQRYPYAFETAAFTLKEGEISDVVESPVGYHIMQGGKHRPTRGQLLCEHILLITKDKPDYEPTAIRIIDSLYNVAQANPASFGDLARKYSDDKNSARNGGRLPWFGTGEMVAEFDSVAHTLEDGEISRPMRTAYGWHIIKRIDHKGAPTKEELRPTFKAMTESPQDPRFKQIRDNQIKRLAKLHKASLNAKTLAAMNADLQTNGLDSTYYAKWTGTAGNVDLAVIDGKNYKALEVIRPMSGILQNAPEYAAEILDGNISNWYNSLLVAAEEDRLLGVKPDYANLYREYVDGSLLYEVSVRKVWDKASKDEEGLKAYFEKNKEKYRWSEPRAKGYLVQVTSDSVGNLIKERSLTLGRDTLVQTIRKEFPKMVSIMKVLEPKGNNAMIDNILFGAPEATTTSPIYTSYFMLDPRVIEIPEEVGDVRGQVISDYQSEFQKEWEKDLRKKYPVTVNEKVLKKVKAKK